MAMVSAGSPGFAADERARGAGTTLDADQAVLRVVGLEDAITGIRELTVLSGDERVAGVEWRLDGRPIPSTGPFTARIDFGVTPQRREIAIVAYDLEKRPLYSLLEVVNPGRRAASAVFRYPLHGTRVEGRTPVRVCVLTAPDDGVASVTLEVAGAVDTRLGLDPAGECRGGGELYAGDVLLPPEPTTLTAQLVTRAGRRVEEAILVNSLAREMDVVDVRLVERLVRVVDRGGGRPIPGLGRGDFWVTEDRLPCRVRDVFDLGDPEARPPLEIALVFDVSRSAWGAAFTLVEARTAEEFLRRFFHPEKDRVLIYAVSSEPQRRLDWSSDSQAIAGALDGIRPRPDAATALHETLFEVFYGFQRGPGSGEVAARAVVLVTDGLNNPGRWASGDPSEEDVLRYARESGVRIYPIAVRKELPGGEMSGIDEGFLARLAAETGGLWEPELSIVLQHEDVSSAQRLVDKIVQRLKNWEATLQQALQAEAIPTEGGPASFRPSWNPEEARRMLKLAQREYRSALSRLEQARIHAQDNERAAVGHARRIWSRIEEDLFSQYLLVFEGRALRTGSSHRIEVGLTGQERAAFQALSFY